MECIETMDAFEFLMAMFLKREGYWTAVNLKVKLAKEENWAPRTASLGYGVQLFCRGEFLTGERHAGRHFLQCSALQLRAGDLLDRGCSGSPLSALRRFGGELQLEETEDLFAGQAQAVLVTRLGIEY